MKATPTTVEKIADFEGCVLTAYKDSVGILTIGYGHTYNVYEGQTITKEKAIELLYGDIENFERIVTSYDFIYHWTQNEFDALVSFTYNIGSLDQLTQDGTRTKSEIAANMLKYVYGGGVVLDGLVLRRRWEHDLFLATNTHPEQSEDFTINIDTIAREVIRGSWGNGEERCGKLGAYFYDIVQNRVNEIMKER